MTAKEQLAVNTMQALKASRKSSTSQSLTGGSSEGTGVSPGVLDEPTVILTTLKQESEYSEEENVDEEIDLVYSNKEEEKKYDDDDEVSILKRLTMRKLMMNLYEVMNMCETMWTRR
nr:hypothetical protein [Tanacetum cinerariifolium]